MTSPLPMLRLLNRPLLQLPIVFGSLMFTVLLVNAAIAPAQWSGRAFWTSALIMPAILGGAFAIARLELQSTSLGWTLPGLRRGLLSGTILGALAVGGLFALVPSLLGAPRYGVPAFAIAVASFLLPGAALDAALPRLVRAAAALPLVLAALVLPQLGREVLGAWVVAQPVLTVLLAAVISAGVLYTIVSAQLARVRPGVPSAFNAGGSLYWAHQRRHDGDWRVDLSTDRLLPWLRAAIHEGGMGRRFGLAGRYLLLGAFIVVWGEVSGMPMMAVIGAGIGFSSSGAQLSGALHYPLDRFRRAQLAYVGTVIDTMAYAAAMLLALGAVRLLPVPLPTLDTGADAVIGWSIAVGTAIVWAPIAQWTVIRWSFATDPSQQRLLGRRTAMMMTYVVVAIVSGHLSARGPLAADPRALLTVLVLLAAAVQAVHWLALRRYYARRELRTLTV